MVVDFAGQLKCLEPAALAYSDLSVSGDANEAAEGLFRALRWAEGQASAQRLLIAGACVLMQRSNRGNIYCFPSCLPVFRDFPASCLQMCRNINLCFHSRILMCTVSTGCGWSKVMVAWWEQVDFVSVHMSTSMRSLMWYAVVLSSYVWRPGGGEGPCTQVVDLPRSVEVGMR